MILSDKPSCYRAASLTHPESKKVESKFRFFSDSLNIINMMAGEHVYFEVETHVTLFNSLRFSLKSSCENYDKKNSHLELHKIQYILKTHPLTQAKDRLIDAHYKAAIPKIANIINHSTYKEADLILMEKELKDLGDLFLVNYIENLVAEITRCITCDHLLTFHKKDLDYFAKLTFSYFYLKGYSRKEITTFVSQLLSGKADKDDENNTGIIYYDGILPQSLLKKLREHNKSNKPFDQTLFNELNEYAKNRGTDGQIRGLIDLDKYTKGEFHFIFKLDGSYLKNDKGDTDEMKIGGLHLFNAKKFLERNKHYLKKDQQGSYVNNFTVFVSQKSKAFHQNEAVSVALNEVRTKLNRIGYIIDKTFILSTSHYLIESRNSEYVMNEMCDRVGLTHWDVHDVTYREKAHKKLEFKNFINENEFFLSDAFSDPDTNKSLHHYSQFTDIITKNALPDNVNYANGHSKRAIALSYMFLLMEEAALKEKLRVWAHNVIINSIPYPTLGKQNQHPLQDFRNRKTFASLTEVNKRYDHPHTRYRIKIALQAKNSNSQKDAFHYYLRYMTMLIRYRNIYEHETITASEEQLARRLKLTINVLFKRLIAYLDKEFKKPANQSLTPQQIINNLITEGQNKATAAGINLPI